MAVAAGAVPVLATSASSLIAAQNSLPSAPGSSGGRALVLKIPQFYGKSIVATKSLMPTVSRNHSVLRGGFALRQIVVAEVDEKKSWDFGKFVQTWQFFNEPFDFGKFVGNIIAKATGSGSAELSSSPAKEIILVAGATGGVGKRVVNELVDRGIPVRALVRNLEKARSLLGPAVDVVTADITQKATLLPEYFEGVRAVVNCVSVTVGPKEGDADRQKYFQGIKFFDPEIKGDSPETVELKGVTNLIEAVKGSTGVREGVTLYGIDARGPVGPAWGSLDDNVMGGVSESSMQIISTGGEDGGPVGAFKGFISLANNGGFASVRTKNFTPPQNLSAYDGLEIRIKGNGRRFKLIIRTTSDWDGIAYTGFFDTTTGWQTIRIPFGEFIPLFRARSVTDPAPLDASSIYSLQLLYSKFEYDGKLNPSFEAGPFEFPIASIKSYSKEPLTPRFIHIGSAGATRPDRPGLDLSKQPPAVRLNKELGYILTYKLKGEDAVRESGIPFTIIRPVALTEEPAGAELIFEQGDNITGKIAREEVARIVVAALKSPAAADTTFEVKSTVPFSQPFTIDPNNPPAKRDYASDFAILKPGVTGKEALEAVSV